MEKNLGQLGSRRAGGAGGACGMGKSLYCIFGRKEWARQGKQAKPVWDWLV